MTWEELTIFLIRFTTQPAIGVDPDNTNLSDDGIALSDDGSALDMDSLLFLAERDKAAGRGACLHFWNKDPCLHDATVCKENCLEKINGVF